MRQVIAAPDYVFMSAVYSVGMYANAQEMRSKMQEHSGNDAARLKGDAGFLSGVLLPRLAASKSGQSNMKAL
jgi:hypothetical protein